MAALGRRTTCLTAERATLSPLASVVTVGLGLVMVAMLLGGPVPLQGRCRQGRLASQCAAAEHRRQGDHVTKLGNAAMVL